MIAPNSPSSAPRSLLMLLVLAVLAWSSVPALANMGDCSNICQRTGMLGRFAGCRCSLTLFTKRAAYGSNSAGLSPDLMRPQQGSEAGEATPLEDEGAQDTAVFPLEDPGVLLFPNSDPMTPLEQEQMQYFQPLLTASKVAQLLTLKRSNLEQQQHQQLAQQQRTRQQQLQKQEQQLQKRLQLRLAESPRGTQDNTLQGMEV